MMSLAIGIVMIALGSGIGLAVWLRDRRTTRITRMCEQLGGIKRLPGESNRELLARYSRKMRGGLLR